jgi:hypothetical protein
MKNSYSHQYNNLVETLYQLINENNLTELNSFLSINNQPQDEILFNALAYLMNQVITRRDQEMLTILINHIPGILDYTINQQMISMSSIELFITASTDSTIESLLNAAFNSLNTDIIDCIVKYRTNLALKLILEIINNNNNNLIDLSTIESINITNSSFQNDLPTIINLAQEKGLVNVNIITDQGIANILIFYSDNDNNFIVITNNLLENVSNYAEFYYLLEAAFISEAPNTNSINIDVSFTSNNPFTQMLDELNEMSIENNTPSSPNQYITINYNQTSENSNNVFLELEGLNNYAHIEYAS